MKSDSNLNKKFDPENWSGWKAFRHYKYTGFNLVDEVNALDPDLVIDVGCGHNRFKGHIQNLIGFDQEPFPFADLHGNIGQMLFRPESADVIMALGSVQFGDKEFVKSNIAKLNRWLKPGGFMIMRTMKDWFRREEYPFMDEHYIWSHEDIEEIGKENSLKLVKGIWTEEIRKPSGRLTSTRLAWWWQKEGELTKHKIDITTCKILPRG